MTNITKAEIRKRLGNITQLQELLFGEQIDEYNHKFLRYNQKLDQLEANTQRFQLVIDERISQLESRLLQKINSVSNSSEKKIKYLNLSIHEKHHQFQKELDAISQQSSDNIDFLQNNLNANTNSLKGEITQTKSAIERDIQLLKQQVLEKLESNLSDLSTNKVSRADLSEVLFELCLKLKGADAGGIDELDGELSSKIDNPELPGSP
ncbi:MAG: hypothetical protein AAF383_03330 [Cyanobacteria bacterium P01_A01_bin.83]